MIVSQKPSSVQIVEHNKIIVHSSLFFEVRNKRQIFVLLVSMKQTIRHSNAAMTDMLSAELGD